MIQSICDSPGGIFFGKSAGLAASWGFREPKGLFVVPGLLRQDVLLASPGPGDSWKCHLLGGRCKVGPLSCSLVPASHTAPFRQSLNFYSVLVESGADATPVVLISGSPPAPCSLPFATHQAEQGKQRSTYSEQMESSSVSPASASAAPRLPLRVPCPITELQ